jgi:hypothetical protein
VVTGDGELETWAGMSSTGGSHFDSEKNEWSGVTSSGGKRVDVSEKE